jgi:hypothetical protein
MNATMNWVESLGSLATEVPAKAEPSPRDRVLDWADRFPAEYKWIMNSSFDFAAAMRNTLNSFYGLTPRQLEAVQKCMRYEASRSAAPAPSTPLDLSKVPEGNYAVPSGDTRLKVNISRGEGKWHGWVFVKDGAAYGTGQRYGMQRPGGHYSGKIEEQLRQIAQDPRAASAAYGQLVGRCGVCGKRLEDAASVARGIGPICASRF